MFYICVCMFRALKCFNFISLFFLQFLTTIWLQERVTCVPGWNILFKRSPYPLYILQKSEENAFNPLFSRGFILFISLTCIKPWGSGRQHTEDKILTAIMESGSFLISDQTLSSLTNLTWYINDSTYMCCPRTWLERKDNPKGINLH